MNHYWLWQLDKFDRGGLQQRAQLIHSMRELNSSLD
jgi:hypothetical protein